MRRHLDCAREEGRWLILVSHEVGDEKRTGLPLETLHALCRQEDAWIDTVANIARFVLDIRQTMP